jgi:hypothetical protein
MSIHQNPTRQPVTGRPDPMRSASSSSSSSAAGSPASTASPSSGRQADRSTSSPPPSVMASSAHAPTADEARRIAECAYFIAERRHFQGGDPLQDWLEAKRQVLRES